MQNEHAPQERAQLEHLNRVLRAIRNVNQLIVREKDRERLIRRACELLVETRGFNGAWIALPGEQPTQLVAAQAGFPQAVFADHIQRIERGNLPTCIRRDPAGETVVLTDNPPLSCAGCPLARFYDGAAALATCLAHEGETYGWLGVSVPPSFAADPEEHNLLAEIAGDLAFALHVIKQDEQHWQIVDALRRSEAQYRLLAGNSVDVIWQMDLRLRFTYASPSIYAMTGYTPEEWVGTKLSQHATFTEFMKMARKAVTALKNYKTIKSIVFEAVLLKKDGSSVPVEISSKLIFNEQGLPIGLQGSTRDITARKQAEQQLAEQLDELSRWYAATLGREGRLIELKREVNALLAQAGQPPRYLSVADEAGPRDLGDLEVCSVFSSNSRLS